MRSCRQALVFGLAGLALLAATARPVWGQMYAGLISPSVTHVELMQRRGKAPIYLVPTNPPAPPYQIGPGDLLDVNVWDNPQLTQSVEVRPDGWITLPLIGDVKAANLTVDQLRAELSKDLAKYIRAPQVVVSVRSPRSHRFSVLGMVVHPGDFELDHPMSLLDAIAAAGGFQDFAKPNKMYVLRHLDNGGVVKVYCNYHDILSGRRSYQNLELQPGDTVVVP